MVDAVVADLKKLLRTGEERGFKSASVLEAVRLYLDRHGMDARDERMFFEPVPVVTRKRARLDEPVDQNGVASVAEPRAHRDVAASDSDGGKKRKNKHDPIAAYASMSLDDLSMRLKNAKDQLEQIHESFRQDKMVKTVYTMNVARYGKRIGLLDAEIAKRCGVKQ
jgi:hypothetical protein